MEYISGKIKIRDIFLDNNNWFLFWAQYADRIRAVIILNVIKIMLCKTKAMGFHQLKCPCCNYEKRVPHTCKSRFCSSCGKKATEQWINANQNRLPNIAWQQITFTLPAEFRPFFWLNRNLLSDIFSIPAQILTELAKEKNVIPGVFTVLHTFGRDLKPNVHWHVIVSLAGLSLDKKKWQNSLYFHHAPIKKMWRQRVIELLRAYYQNKQLILPKSLNFIQTTTDFNNWTAKFYQKNWVVHLAKTEKKHHRMVKYIGRYLKRPPISETRIKAYDGHSVTYNYKDHHDKKSYTLTLPVFEFIKRLIRHIPDHYFRMIRYYNWLSNRTRGILLPLVHQLLKQTSESSQPITWRQLFLSTFNVDPMKCPNCNIELRLCSISFGEPVAKMINRAKKHLLKLFKKN